MSLVLGGLSGSQRLEHLLSNGQNALGVALGGVGAILESLGRRQVARRLGKNGVDIRQRGDRLVDAASEVRDLLRPQRDALRQGVGGERPDVGGSSAGLHEEVVDLAHELVDFGLGRLGAVLGPLGGQQSFSGHLPGGLGVRLRLAHPAHHLFGAGLTVAQHAFRFLGQAEGVLRLRDGALVAREGAAFAAAAAAAEAVARVAAPVAHGVVQIGQRALDDRETGAQVGQVGGVPLLALAELRGDAGEERLGAPPLTLRVADRLLGELDAVLRLLRPLTGLAGQIQRSLHVRLLQARGVVLESLGGRLQIGRSRLQAGEREGDGEDSLRRVFQLTVQVVHLFARQSQIRADHSEELFELRQFASAEGGVRQQSAHLRQLRFHRFEFTGVGSRGARFADLAGSYDDLIGLAPEFLCRSNESVNESNNGKRSWQYLEDAIPVVEALSAGLAVGHDGADVAPSALVALLASHSRQTDASAVRVVALEGRRAERVAVARLAVVLGRVAPVVGAALVAPAPAEAAATLALAVELVALRRQRADGVAVARLAALAGRDLPVVGRAAVAGDALDVRQARALARLAVAHGQAVGRGDAAEQVAHARAARLGERVAEEAPLAHLAAEALRAEEALQALARAPVAVARPREVDVVAALARPAAAAGRLRVAEVVVGAHVAARPGVALLALAHHVLRVAVERAPGGVRVARVDRAGARAGPAGDVHAEARVAVERVETVFAVVAGGRVAAVGAPARPRVAQVRVSVAFAALARREVPGSTKQKL